MSWTRDHWTKIPGPVAAAGFEPGTSGMQNAEQTTLLHYEKTTPQLETSPGFNLGHTRLTLNFYLNALSSSSYFYLFCSDRDWCISGLLSANCDGIFSTHLHWREIKSLLRKNFGDFIVPHFFKHCFKSSDLLTSELRIQKSLQKDIWKMSWWDE